MTYIGRCEECGQPVITGSGQSHREPAYPVTGWEVARKAGGANHIRNRERVPGRVRHVGCLPDPNINDDQETLL